MRDVKGDEGFLIGGEAQAGALIGDGIVVLAFEPAEVGRSGLIGLVVGVGEQGGHGAA